MKEINLINSELVGEYRQYQVRGEFDRPYASRALILDGAQKAWEFTETDGDHFIIKMNKEGKYYVYVKDAEQ